jgi:S-formylglutathione hydrolase
MNQQGNNRPFQIVRVDPFFVKRAITMKSLRWVLIAAFLLILEPLTQASELDSITLNSKLVPGKVEVSVLLPPGFDRRSKPHKLLLWLHGGGNDSSYLDRVLRPIVEKAWEEGHLPQLVVAVPSARRSFYMDYRDGSEKWETLILKELLPALQSKYGLRKDQRGTLIGGYSMGGMGSLRIAFKYPDRFAAVAAIAPAIEPVYKFNEIQPVDRAYRNNGIYEKIFGNTVDQDYWQANHPPAIARDRSNVLVASKMKIYFEVGDADSLGLYRGGEFLHRLLLGKGVKHEYRLVHGADHNDTSIPARLSDAMQFLGRGLEDRETTDTATSQLAKEVKAHMEHYVALFNNEQAEAIAGEIYLAPVLTWKSGDENQSVDITEKDVREDFESSFKIMKANGWKQSVIHGMDIRIAGEDLAFVDMRFSRLMADGKPIPPVQRTWSYVLVKREAGWRIISAHGQSAASSAEN